MNKHSHRGETVVRRSEGRADRRTRKTAVFHEAFDYMAIRTGEIDAPDREYIDGNYSEENTYHLDL